MVELVYNSSTKQEEVENLWFNLKIERGSPSKINTYEYVLLKSPTVSALPILYWCGQRSLTIYNIKVGRIKEGIWPACLGINDILKSQNPKSEFVTLGPLHSPIVRNIFSSSVPQNSGIKGDPPVLAITNNSTHLLHLVRDWLDLLWYLPSDWQQYPGKYFQQSPIQVPTEINVVWLYWSNENLYISNNPVRN